MIAALRIELAGRADAVLRILETRLDRLIQAWLLVAGLACAARIAISPVAVPDVRTLAPYLLLLLAPFASIVLALRWFGDGERAEPPSPRLALPGRWRPVRRAVARRHPLYGANGIMVSLLVGILLNIPVRATEYLVAMPALGGPLPGWLAMLHLLLTFDVVLFGSLYAIAFVAALRLSPVFPRLLAAIWAADLVMQWTIAKLVGAAPDLPVAVAGALHGLLEGNVMKVLISMALWLPYLILSRRVNLTYRGRLPA